MTLCPSHRLLRALATIAALAVAGFGTAHAHPLGQNAFNREAAIVVAPDQVHLDYLLDLAEIPTLEAGSEADTDGNGEIADGEWATYAERWAKDVPGKIVVEVGGQPLPLELESQSWALSPGQSGLTTLRLLAKMKAPLALTDAAVALAYRDGNPERLGWREVSISAAAGVRIVSSDVPAISRTKSMTDFTPRAEGPPAITSATAQVALAAADAPAAEPPVVLEIGARSGAAQPEQTRQSPTVWSFFKLGVHHIAIGWDHLIFLLGLVLLSGNLKQLAFTVTAFTVAHSITLGLASQGLVTPPPNWVEALIAATIAYVGIVALRTRRAKHGPVLAFGFGLIHGFGFAGALAESVGADSKLNLIGLLSFNVGIEFFQLLLVCAVVPVLAALARRPWYPRVHLALGSFVFLAGAFWFLERTLRNDLLTEIGFALTLAALVGVLLLSKRKAALEQA
ncbi:MAG TPA: HupE/UreJ family protein [Nevskia sp.]|nr:HupE/UreJ family protein [Nevskia sp.]